MSFNRTILLLTIASAMCACGTAPPVTPDDAGPIVLTDSGPTAACEFPMEGYGTSEGRNFRPFTLNRCDGTPYEFYSDGDGFCDSSFSAMSKA